MKKNIKLVVSDLDGTLLSDDKTIHEKNYQAIKDLRNAGIHFSISTGRSLQMTKAYINSTGMKSGFVSTYNGALVQNVAINAPETIVSFQDDVFLKIYDFVKSSSLNYLIYTQKALYYLLDLESERFHYYVKQLSENDARSVFLPIKKFQHHSDDNPVLKVGLHSSDLELIEKLYVSLAKNTEFEVTRSLVDFIEIMPRGVSKGAALHTLAKAYDVSLDEIAVFGDEENDISMLKIAGLSFAMDNAQDKIKKCAQYVTGLNNDAGFAQGVWEYIL